MRKELALVLPFLCLLVLLPFPRIATGQGLVITNDIAVSDMANLFYPIHHFAGRELHQGRLPLWAPGIYMGFPLLAEGQVGAFYPPNLLLFGLLSVTTALNLSVLLPFATAAVGAYLLARELGAGIVGALLAGFSYALSGFYVAHVKHMAMVDAASWVPVVLWLVERGVKRSDSALLGAGLAMGMQWLTGMPQYAYYTSGIASLYFAGRAWQSRRERSLRRIVPLYVLATALSLGLAAVQLLPTYEMVGFSERAGGASYEFAASFPYALDNLKTFLYPLINGTPGTGDLSVSSIFWEDYSYFGLIPLFLGIFGGLVLIRHSNLARLLAGLSALAFLLALGPNIPLHRLAYRFIPGFGFFRFPQRFLTFAVLLLIVLAALALTRFQAWLGRKADGGPWNRIKGRNPSRVLGGIVLMLVIVDQYYYHIPWNAIVNAETWLTPPETARVIQERSAASLYRVFSYDVFSTFRAAYRQAGGWRGDLQPYIAQREFLQPSFNLVFDVPAADGYINLVPECLATLWGTEKKLGLMDTGLVEVGDQLTEKPGFVKSLGLYNVRFLIAAQPVQDEALELVGVYGPGAHLYENHEAMPRAFAVPGYTVADDLRTALAMTRSFTFDPTGAVILLQQPDAPASPPQGFEATVEVVTYQPTRVVITVEANGPGWLVLSDTFYPGWEATVDDDPVRIYQANGCVRAVPIQAGQHEVAFRFRPRPLYRGALISGVSGLAWVAVWLALRFGSGAKARAS